ncbi:MAG TPA: MFS transporter [Pararobbsia sp.]|nr:MFS transporter [Pararobbsia sp.]
MEQIRIDLRAVLDDGPLRFVQVQVALLSFLAVLVDGFDTQAIGYIAPALVANWHVARASLGAVFASGLIGVTFGALLLGPASDRWGRKPVLVLSLAWFGAFSLASAAAGSPHALLLLRFLTGLGLGGVMPIAIALTAEYTPARFRATFVMAMLCGFSLGAAFGGVLAAAVVAAFGWRMVLVVGGAAPLMLVPILIVCLPESLQFLATRRASPARIRAVITRFLPAGVTPEAVVLPTPDPDARHFPVAALFARGRRLTTVMLWVIFFSSLCDLYLISNWLPLLLGEAGFSAHSAVLVATLFQIGGTVGTLLLGRAIDLARPFVVLMIVYLTAALCVSALGWSVGMGVAAAAATVFFAGFCVVGGQIGANALAGRVYPTSMRVTGVGWALGVGRIGSIVGPSLAGVLMLLHWDATHIFLLGAVPLALAALAASVIHWSAAAPAVGFIQRGIES